MDADAAAAPCRKPASHSLPQPPLLFAVRARSGRVADLGAGGAAFSGPPDTPPPPALFAVRARSGRVADLGAGGAAFSGPPDTPPRPSLVTVPFLWEEAPGMPKASPTACAAATTPNAADVGPVPEGETGDRQDSSGHADQAARPLPLKLPPRLQQVPASFAAADTRQGSGHADKARPLPPLKLPPRLQQVSASFAAADTPLSSPKTVFQGPYYARAGGGRRTPRWARSGGAAFRRTTSAGVALFSRTWSKRRAAAPAAGRNKNRCDIHERDAAGPDAPWYSPASPSSSSSSVSTCFGGDDHGRGRPADGREVASEEDDGSPRSSVRITRFRLRRNRSLPSMSTSNLWAAADWIASALRVLAKPQSPGPMADEAVVDEAACLAEATRQRVLALDQHEADHTALWAQATAVLNIKTLIPVTLDSAANNFSKWRGLFLVVLGKYALTRHVLYDEALSGRPVWVRMDCMVLTWIYGIVSNDLLQSLMIHSFNARGAWRFLEDEFQNHSESRALLLETQFRNLRQGSMSVGDYCRRLETMAAALGEFGDPISDRQMVLTLLHGLNSKFRHMMSNLKMRRPFPTFAEARTHLQLEEVDLDVAPPSPPGAMVADPPPCPTGLAGPPSSRPAHPFNPNGPRHNYNNNRRRGRGGKSSAPGSSSSFAPGGAASPHPSFAHPWVGTMQMWSYDHAPVVAPCPPLAMVAAPLGTLGFPPYGHPGPYYGGASGAPPLQQFAPASLPPQQQMMPSPLHPQQLSKPMQGGSWDQPSLAHSFSTMTLNPPSAPSEWNADSGEGSHMTSDAGKHP